MNLLKEAREVTRSCSDPVRSTILRDRTDALSEALDLFMILKDRESMRDLVAKWTLVIKGIDAITASEPLPPSAGKIKAPATPLAA